ncbi:hypothetical protein DER45DRAFT_578603 [Fusarium avenaceum]|nr:hypothetical protein DER45DRAFT_578603 [Fusarium avenaceum]
MATAQINTKQGLLPHSQGKPQQATKKRRKNTPVRRPSTPTPTARPKARPQSGSRSSRGKQLSIQQLRETTTAILADRSRGPRYSL